MSKILENSEIPKKTSKALYKPQYRIMSNWAFFQRHDFWALTTDNNTKVNHPKTMHNEKLKFDHQRTKNLTC